MPGLRPLGCLGRLLLMGLAVHCGGLLACGAFAPPMWRVPKRTGAGARSVQRWGAAGAAPTGPHRALRAPPLSVRAPAVAVRRCRPLQASYPSTEEAADAGTLQEGMAINEWEHRADCEWSERVYALKLGEDVYPHAARPPLEPFPNPVPLVAAGKPVDWLHMSEGPLFTAAECDAIVQEAEEREEWVIGGDWHTTFPGIDLPVEKLPQAMEFLQTALPCRLFPFLAAALPELCVDPARLRVSDLFLVKYNEKLGQTSLPKHQDKGLISVNIALNEQSEYGEGGTFIDALNRVAKIPKGTALVHSSGLWHAGHPITTGTRYILVGFVISTDCVEHFRRFGERGAMLRNEVCLCVCVCVCICLCICLCLCLCLCLCICICIYVTCYITSDSIHAI